MFCVFHLLQLRTRLAEQRDRLKSSKNLLQVLKPVLERGIAASHPPDVGRGGVRVTTMGKLGVIEKIASTGAGS